jgi:hypothetical protein
MNNYLRGAKGIDSGGDEFKASFPELHFCDQSGHKGHLFLPYLGPSSRSELPKPHDARVWRYFMSLSSKRKMEEDISFYSRHD